MKTIVQFWPFIACVAILAAFIASGIRVSYVDDGRSDITIHTTGWDIAVVLVVVAGIGAALGVAMVGMREKRGGTKGDVG